jgi:AbrB family looped-hinge helix DNA binding protein
MPKKKAVDAAKLISMVKDGLTQAEIMKKMGFKSSTQVKAAYMGALIAEGKIPAIRSGRGKAKSAGKKAVGVGKRGSIVIPKDIVGSLGIGSGDKFVVKKTKAGIALKKS